MYTGHIQAFTRELDLFYFFFAVLTHLFQNTADFHPADLVEFELIPVPVHISCHKCPDNPHHGKLPDGLIESSDLNTLLCPYF